MTPQARHVACNSCRQRKTRCDGNQPCCNQCATRSSACSYIRPEVQDQQEILGLLKDLTQRLSAFENNLAPQYKSIAPGFEHDAVTDPVLFASDDMVPSDLGTVEQTSDDNIFMMPEVTDIDYHQILADLETSSPPIFGDMFPVPMMSWYDANKLVEPRMADNVVASDSELQNIYQTYTYKANSGCFMIDPDHFHARLREVPEAPEVSSLKYALLAQGASASATHLRYKEDFYKLACKSFEQIKASNQGRNIVALQACVLIAFYELQHVHFEKARASLNRAVLMSKIFGLDRIDQRGDFTPVTGDTLSELEEQRRTFWTVFNLSCFASITAGWNAHALIDYNQITTFLPTSLPLDQVTSSSKITLSQVLCPSSSPEASSTAQGYIVSFAILGFAFVHLENSSQRLNPALGQGDFWLQHYQLCEALVHIFETFGTDQPSLVGGGDSDPICMFLNLHATNITLHFAANLQIANSKTSPLPVLIDHETKYLDSAIRIAETTGAVCQMDRGKIGPYIPWAIYVAAQIFVRDLQQVGISSNPNHLDALQKKAAPGTTGLGTSQHIFLDYIQRLLGTLSILTLHSPIAGLFISQINLEIMGGKPFTDLRLIGRVENLVPGFEILHV
ncbi:uncharacterized protein N7503_007625 [Penicillium pulvis]|uniref:uncharacterized protein n=1 Tax=Penicillium pulvis TaxID=1562058 RepID=UPI0025474EF8|nr:uncharacterized protein N7503_007625 [Penicillium pulvis]KAJ5798329.1 hypothetical protein N7503_007625 [Penicillium pulvis]